MGSTDPVHLSCSTFWWSTFAVNTWFCCVGPIVKRQSRDGEVLHRMYTPNVFPCWLLAWCMIDGQTIGYHGGYLGDSMFFVLISYFWLWITKCQLRGKLVRSGRAMASALAPAATAPPTRCETNHLDWSPRLIQGWIWEKDIIWYDLGSLSGWRENERKPYWWPAMCSGWFEHFYLGIVRMVSRCVFFDLKLAMKWMAGLESKTVSLLL